MTLERRRGYGQQMSATDSDEETSEEDSDEDTEESSDEDAISEAGEEELAVLERAMGRMARAQAKGKTQVKLKRDELAAMERHQQREAQALRRQERRDRRERVAVPIAHLAGPSGPFRRTTKQILPSPGSSGNDTDHDNDHGSQRVPGSFHEEHQPVYPPVGYFPPPGASSARMGPPPMPAPGTPTRNRGESPFTYSYLRSSPSAASVSSSRQVSDPTPGADPFQYLTAGPRAPQYHSGAAAASRGSMAAPAAARGRAAGTARRDASSDEQEEEGEEEESPTDQYRSNSRRQPARPRSRPPSRQVPEAIAAAHNLRSRAKQAAADSGRARRRPSTSEDEPQPAPEPEPERPRSSKSKKPTRSSSTATKHRRSIGEHSSRRRKGK